MIHRENTSNKKWGKERKKVIKGKRERSWENVKERSQFRERKVSKKSKEFEWETKSFKE